MAASGDAPALAVCIVLVTAQRQITAMEDTDLAAAVIKSPADKKEYRLLRLPNGLNALLIHDPSINVNQEATGDAEGGSDANGSDEGSAEGSEAEGSGSGGSSMEEDSDDGSEEGEGEEGDAAEGRGAAAATKKAAAALAVGIGSFSDPRDLQGLSHYLEHMLFMGSAAFPDENEYDAYLNKHGGCSNAYTELEYTNYHFEVQPAALRGALERFAQFFVAPLFRPDALEREVQAVDSEFVGVQQSDHSRLSQLMCHTCKPDHVYSKFSWGNKRSLWDQPAAAGIDVPARLQQYYKQQYSAERMALVVLGGQPLEELEEWVGELFGGVPGGLGPRPSFSGQGMPFQGCKLYLAAAVKEHHEVNVTFQLPCLRHLYRDKPDHYLSHLIGHEGPGSLLSCLKKRGWATEIMAGIDDDGYSANTCCYLFSVSIQLTEAGLHAGPGYGLAPVALLMQYLKLLRETGPQHWVWEELVSITQMRWRFQEEEEAQELVTRLAATLGWIEEARHVLVSDYLHEAWRPDVVMSLLEHMHPVNSSYRVDLLTKAFPQLTQQLQQQQQQQQQQQGSATATGTAAGAGLAWPSVELFTEPWFEMQGACAELPQQLRDSWAEAAVDPELALPPPNPYLPSDFNLRSPPAAGSAADVTTDAPAGKQTVPAVDSQKVQPRTTRTRAAAAATAAAAAAASSKGGKAGASAGVSGKRKRKEVDLQQDAAAGQQQEQQVEPVLGPPPKLVLDQPGCRVWHLLDTRFSQPGSHLLFRLSSPAAARSAREAALQHLWLKVLEEVLNEDAYLADVAGIHYSTSPEGVLGVELRVDGFSHKLPLLVQRIFSCLLVPEVKPEAFAAVHEALLRRYRNLQMHVAKAAAYARVYALSAHMWHSHEVERELEAVAGVGDVQAYASSYLSSCHLEALCTGNVDQREALDLVQQLLQQLGGGAVLPIGARPQEACTRVPVGTRLLYREPTKNPQEDNSAVELYLQVGPCSDLRLRVLNDLLDQVLFEPCYDTLRTKQQLGYTVHSGTRLTYGTLGYAVVVVSAAYGAQEVEERIEAFLQQQEAVLQDMSSEEFSRHVSSLSSLKLQQDQSLGQESSRLWEQVWSARYEFTCREQEVALLQQLTQQDLLGFFRRFIMPGAPERRQMVVHVVPAKSWGQQGEAPVAPTAAQQAAEGHQHEVAHVDKEAHHHPPLTHVADSNELADHGEANGASSSSEPAGPSPELVACWGELKQLRQQLDTWPHVSSQGGL